MVTPPPTTTSTTIYSSPKSHCHHTEDPYIPLLKRVTAVALITLAAITDINLFIPSFVGGVAVGIFQHFYREKKCVESDQITSCAHGFLEQTTGVQLPEVISVIGGAALYYCHIEHHPEVCVPLSAIIGGIWCVELVAKMILKKPHAAHA